MSSDDDLIAALAIGAVAVIAAAIIASLLSQATDAQRRNPDYLRGEVSRSYW